jgi:hypothetical protein
MLAKTCSKEMRVFPMMSAIQLYMYEDTINSKKDVQECLPCIICCYEYPALLSGKFYHVGAHNIYLQASKKICTVYIR